MTDGVRVCGGQITEINANNFLMVTQNITGINPHQHGIHLLVNHIHYK